MDVASNVMWYHYSDDYDRATSKMIDDELMDTTDVDSASPRGGGLKRKCSSSNSAARGN